jgi:flagellar basal body rod protein FlgG
MINSLAISASALTAFQQRQATRAGNVANVSSAGYQRTDVQMAEAPARSGVRVNSSKLQTAQGPIVPTGRSLDVAVRGDAWISVRGPGGQALLTRAGTLNLGANGELITSGGDAVGGTVQVPAGTSASSIAIARDGSVSANGVPAGRIELVTVPVPSALTPMGNGLYAASVGSGAVEPAGDDAGVVQGHLEMPANDLVEDVTGMGIDRHVFAANAAVMRTADEMLAEAARIAERR